MEEFALNFVYGILTGIAGIICVILGNYYFHATTKGNHFREWKELQPVNTPAGEVISSCSPRGLRRIAYQALRNTLEDYKKTLEISHIHEGHIYRAIKVVTNYDMYETDRTHIRFAVLALETVDVINQMSEEQLIKFSKEFKELEKETYG